MDPDPPVEEVIATYNQSPEVGMSSDVPPPVAYPIPKEPMERKRPMFDPNKYGNPVARKVEEDKQYPKQPGPSDTEPKSSPPDDAPDPADKLESTPPDEELQGKDKSVSSFPGLPKELEDKPESQCSKTSETHETSVQPTRVVQTWCFEKATPQPGSELADQATRSDDTNQLSNSEYDNSRHESMAENTQGDMLVQAPGFNCHPYGQLGRSRPTKVTSPECRTDPARVVDGTTAPSEHTPPEDFDTSGASAIDTNKDSVVAVDSCARSSEFSGQESLNTLQEPSITMSLDAATSAHEGPNPVSDEVSEHEDTQSEVANSSFSSITRKELDAEVRSKPHIAHQTAIMSKPIVESHSKPSSSDKARATVIPRNTAHHRQNAEPPVTYETLKQPGESPEETMRRLQVAKQREVVISIQQTQDKKGGHTANLAELKSLRNPLTPDQLKSLGISASPSITTPNGSQLFPAVTHSTPSGSPSPLSLQRPSQPVKSKVGNSNESQPRPSPLGQLHRFTNSADENNLSVYKNKLLAPWTSNTQFSHQDEWEMAKEITTSVWATNDHAVEMSVSGDSGSMYHMGIGCDLGEGGLGVRQQPGAKPDPIIGWDGQLVPPPVDWEMRPRYNTERGYVDAGFLAWLGQTVRNTLGIDARPQLQFERVPTEVVLDLSLHPDGIGFVPRDVLISAGNAQHYGYNINLKTETFLDAVPTLADFDAVGRVDGRLPENLPYKDETVNMLIERKMQHVQLDTKRWEEYCNERKVSEERRLESIKQAMEVVPTIETPRPRVNLYLRPALERDIPGMTAVLNWHIKNGVRTSELGPISEQDMQLRLDMAKQSKLPFIVAIERTRRNTQQKSARRALNPNHPIQNTGLNHNGLVKDEHVVGWVSAVDWSCVDYVECISAELELYVAHDYRRKGIGRCLLDSLLDATDPDYTKEGGYDFTVAPEIAHMYNCGGNRQLHKIIFQVRTYNKPLTVKEQKRRDTYLSRYSGIANGNGNVNHVATGSNASASTGKQSVQWSKNTNEKPAKESSIIDDLEDDYNLWLRKWLEGFGFEEESCLKKIGTKNRRFLDSRYLTRETSWQPADRKLPDYAEYPI
ncbi:hypothetical protein LTR84_005454 [Exophiala bonariae]|uniref:N-acetyltransferase domain-containing protein n=1 Tax=Exophiala bonariae TaxID=1690606 RepID=A0AAV9N838_9EURO|nr:hypothetical protein LTR84_005454 [Exophiala bonariae]